MDEPGEAAPDAFQALGNEVRLSALQYVLDHEDEGPVPFSTLHEQSSVEESAGFAYHLRQLTDRYLRKVDDEGYVLTYAGRKVARAVAAGTYTDSVDLDPVELDDPCPFCDAETLVARSTDNTVGVACEDCERPVLSLAFPPSGYRDRDPESLPEAFDAHHRHRLSLLREGVCPECAGAVTTTTSRVDALPEDDADRIQSVFECGACGYETRSPVALTLLDHPAVVAFYHDHDEDVRDRPIWNVGEEWRETVLSTDPWAVGVSTRLDDELLELFVDREGRVVESRRSPVDAEVGTDAETEPLAESTDPSEGESAEPA